MRVNRLYFLCLLGTLSLIQNILIAESDIGSGGQKTSNLYQEDSLRKAEALSSRNDNSSKNEQQAYNRDRDFPSIGEITVHNYYHGSQKKPETETTIKSIPTERVPSNQENSTPQVNKMVEQESKKELPKPSPQVGKGKSKYKKDKAKIKKKKKEIKSKAVKSSDKKSTAIASNHCCTDDYGSIGRKKFDLAIFGGGGVMYSLLSNLYTGDAKLGQNQLDTVSVDGLVARFGGGLKLNAGSEKKFFFLNASLYGNMATDQNNKFDTSQVGLDFRGQLGLGYVLGNPNSKWFYAAKLIGLDLTYLDLTPMLVGHINMPSGSDNLASIRGNMKQMAIGIFTGVRFTEHVGDRHIFSQGIGISVGPSFFTGDTSNYSNNVGMAINLMLFFEHNIRMTESMFFRWFVESDNSFNISFSPRIPINIDGLDGIITDVKGFISKVETLTSSNKTDEHGNPIIGAVPALLNSVSALTQNITFVTTFLQRSMSDIFSSLSHGMEESLANSINTIKDTGIDIVNELMDLLDKEVIDKITKPILSQNLGTVQSIFETMDAVSEVMKNLPTILKAFQDKLSSSISGFSDILTDQINQLVKDTFGNIDVLISSLTQDIATIFNGIIGVGLEDIASNMTDSMMSGYLQDHYGNGIQGTHEQLDKIYKFLSALENNATTADVLDNTALEKIIIKKDPTVSSSGQHFYQMSYEKLKETIQQNLKNNTPNSDASKIFEHATTDIMLKYISIKDLAQYTSANQLGSDQLYEESFGSLIKKIYDYNKDDIPAHSEAHRHALDTFQHAVEQIFPQNAKEIMDLVSGLSNITQEEGIVDAINNLLHEVGGLSSSASDLLSSISNAQISNPGFSAGITAYPRVNVGIGIYWRF